MGLTDEERELIRAHAASFTIEELGVVVKEIAHEFMITEEQVLGRSRRGDVVQARHLAWYVLAQRGWPHAWIAREFGRDHATVVYGLHKVERSQETRRLAKALG